jgi:hypothetical protein
VSGGSQLSAHGFATKQHLTRKTTVPPRTRSGCQKQSKPRASLFKAMLWEKNPEHRFSKRCSGFFFQSIALKSDALGFVFQSIALKSDALGFLCFWQPDRVRGGTVVFLVRRCVVANP